MKQERTTHIIRYVHIKICANHGTGKWHWLNPSPGLLSAGDRDSLTRSGKKISCCPGRVSLSDSNLYKAMHHKYNKNK